MPHPVDSLTRRLRRGVGWLIVTGGSLASISLLIHPHAAA
jgi:hypothetical protein